jgi:hypothetical protein
VAKHTVLSCLVETCGSYGVQVNTNTDRGVVERRTSRLTLVDLAGTGLPLLCNQLQT